MKPLRRALFCSLAAPVLAGCPGDDASPRAGEAPVPEAEAAESKASETATAGGEGAEKPADDIAMEAQQERSATGGADPERADPERANENEPNFHLPGPTLAGWEPTFYSEHEPLEAPPDGYSHLAVITGRQVGLYSEPGDRFPTGIARTGGRIPANPASGSGCSGGAWYEVSGDAYLCSAQGVHIAEGEFEDGDLESVTTDLQRTRLPRVTQPNLFRHGIAQDGAPFFRELPSESAIETMRGGDVPDEGVHLRAEGAYILALTDEVEAHGETFYQTIYGSFIRADDVDERELSPMHGEWIYDVDDELPLAFSYRDSELHCVREGAAEPCGTVAKHARFPVRGTLEHDGLDLVLAGDGVAIPREDVRVARPTDRPDAYAADDKWIHIDLSEQALLAYRGDTPVFATLISSGREGFHTPTGSYRVDRMYHSKTMRGTGGDGLPYQVQEVPWALYYDGNFAAHGAYWHEDFGTPQSHGCVNIPPLDARWLYYWGDVELPQGWHADKELRGKGIYVTGETPPDEPSEADEEDRA